MKILKKISLTIIGILLSLIILEISLQIAGFTLITIKKYRNNLKKDPNTITILCLGESTTDEQWPPILQKILDKKAKSNKFNVIDEGHAGKNTEYLFYEIIEKKLSKYNPDIIGTNDAFSDKPYIMQNEHWYYKLRLYRLIILIKDHIENKLKYSELNTAEKNINIPQDKITIIEDIAKNTDKLKNNKNLYLIKSIIKNYPNINWYEHMIPALVNPYFYEIILKKQEKYTFKLDDFIEYYNYDLNIENIELSNIYVCFAKKFFEQKDIDNAVRCAKTALLYNSDCINSLKNIMEFDTETIHADRFYTQKTSEKNFYKITPVLYKNIVSYCYKNNIKYYIAMQYPTLSIELLKEDLKDSPYYNKLIFISNEENFKQALKNHKTGQIFTDMFGGSWGHCTELGNTLIAENVAETVLKLYN